MIDEYGRLPKLEVTYSASQPYNVETLLNDEPLAKGYKGFIIYVDKEHLDEFKTATIDVFYDNIGEILVWAETRDKLHESLRFIKSLNSHAHCINFPPEPKKRNYPYIGYEVVLTFKFRENK